MLTFKQGTEFNFLKHYLMVFLLIPSLLLTSCSSLKLTSPKEDKKNNQIQSVQSDKVQSEGFESESIEGEDIQRKTVPTMLDPMAEVHLPLTLIKGYDEIKILVKSEQKQQIKQKLITLHQQHPESSGPSYRLARLLFEEKDYQQALDWINKSIQINPKNYYAFNLKGILLRELGKFDQAKEVYLNAIEIYSDFPTSHLNLAILADIYLYDWPLALKHYEIYAIKNKTEDKKATGWILDIKRRIAASQPTG